MTIEVQELVRRFNLLPHPEGGYFHETYRGVDQVRRLADDALRSSSTAIYYLLDNGAYSAWHRIASDEIWHFYAGSPLLVHVLTPTGDWLTHKLGHPVNTPEGSCQVVVPAGCWFAAELEDPQTWGFVGCTVAPGFEFAEFELARPDALRQQFPQHATALQRLLSRNA